MFQNSSVVWQWGSPRPKRLIPFFVVFTVLCLLGLKFVSPSESIAQTLPPDIQNIKSQGELRVGIVEINKTNRTPFFMKNKQGEYHGFDIDLAKSIAAELGVPVRFVYSKTFEAVVDSVFSRKADVGISMLTANTRRAQKVSFTQPYYHIRQVVAVNRVRATQLKIEIDSSLFDQLNVNAVKLGVLKNSTFEDLAQHHFGQASFRGYESVEKMRADLESGQIDAALCDEVMINGWVQRDASFAIHVSSRFFDQANDPIAIAVNWQDNHFLRWLNLHLSQLEKQGHSQSLKQKYFKTSSW